MDAHGRLVAGLRKGGSDWIEVRAPTNADVAFVLELAERRRFH